MMLAEGESEPESPAPAELSPPLDPADECRRRELLVTMTSEPAGVAGQQKKKESFHGRAVVDVVDGGSRRPGILLRGRILKTAARGIAAVGHGRWILFGTCRLVCKLVWFFGRSRSRGGMMRSTPCGVDVSLNGDFVGACLFLKKPPMPT